MMNRETRRKCKNTYEMANRIEYDLNKKYKMYYENKYQKDLADAIDYFLLAIVYTLHFNEKTSFGNARIIDFMEDLMATVDNFKTGAYNPKEYTEILQKEGIKIIKSKKGDN